MKRIDVLLVDQQLAKSRTEAQKLIAGGQVEVEQAGAYRAVAKASEKFEPETEFKISYGEEQKYVSRAGLKLEAALAAAGVNVQGLLALDIGQSTGGFTDCLLQHGAAHVVGVEVGRGQLQASLMADARVDTLEQYNARTLKLDDLPSIAQQGFDLVVMDVSFISQQLILPNIPAVLKSGGLLLSLVKPQFEAGKEYIGKKGLVTDKKVYLIIEQRIREHLASIGLTVLEYMKSPIKGGDGNREFLVVARFDNNTE